MKNKFSIVIPIYNSEEYLEKCLDSIVKQTYTNYEVIIICDKCSDNSEIIVDKYVKKYKWTKIYEENTGLSKARNIGISKSTGDYLVFLDGDDYLENDYLEVINNNLEDKPNILRIQVRDIYKDSFVNYNEVAFDTTNGIEAFNKIIQYHYIENAWAYIYNRCFWNKNKFKYMENCIAEDYGLTPLIIAKADKIKSISYIGYNYVKRENSLMNTIDYNKKIKKMDDMLKQADYLHNEFKNIKNNERFISFINNSLIYYSTRLNYKDFKKYNKILKEKEYFKHLKSEDFKTWLINFMIKKNAYFYHNKIVR